MRWFLASITLLTLSCSDNFSLFEHIDRCDLDLDAELAERIGSEVNLAELTNFDWDEVRIYGEYTPSELVRSETKLNYEPRFFPYHVPEGQAFVVFLHRGGGVCGAHYDLAKACLVPLAEAAAPQFQVGKRCERPS